MKTQHSQKNPYNPTKHTEEWGILATSKVGVYKLQVFSTFQSVLLIKKIFKTISNISSFSQCKRSQLCCSVSKSCSTLFNPKSCNTPGFPVLHYLLDIAQTHVHWVGDAIQPSNPLSSPYPPAFSLSSRVFSNESVLPIRWPKNWSFSFSISPSNEYSWLISFRIDWFDLKGLTRVFSKTTVCEVWVKEKLPGWIKNYWLQ